MYGVVLAAALASGTAVPDWGFYHLKYCHGCWGGYTCYCYGCFGCYNCHGCFLLGHKHCVGCYGFTAVLGYAHGCYSCSGCCSCYGCGCGCWGCACAGVPYMPVITGFPVAGPVCYSGCGCCVGCGGDCFLGTYPHQPLAVTPTVPYAAPLNGTVVPSTPIPSTPTPSTPGTTPPPMKPADKGDKGTEGTSGTAATVVIKADIQAAVLVNGQPTIRRQAEQSFSTPPLLAGEKYTYTVSAILRRDGQTFRRTKIVGVEAGKRVTVDFSDLTETPVSTTGDIARLTLRVPANARVYVNDQLIDTTRRNTFETPRLQPGQDYFYTVRLEMVRDGRIVTESRLVEVSAGKTVTVDFLGTDKLTVSR
jgi:uncharacterized protein (TIGR03000 family)